MAERGIEIVERDNAGNALARYVQSVNDEGRVRLDTILPEVTKLPWQRLLDVFLPDGYPHSVTSDYLEYQIYDSLQAFASSIAGLLSSRAVLSSVGVGDSSASPTAALLLSILQESAGRVATIFFAHRFGTALEPECKMYRLLADILNDLAFVLDCLSPAFPKAVRVVILSFSSVLRALCGVAAGSAKASLSAHFAQWGNLGELNAKDSSQETVISLLGMLAGSLIVQWVQSPMATWTTLTALLAIHLETNRRAVRAVTMRTLNRQRATLVFHELQRGRVPTPEEVAKKERIFERDGALRSADGRIRGYCTIGVSVAKILRGLAPPASTISTLDDPYKSRKPQRYHLSEVLSLYKDAGYIMGLKFQGRTSHFDVVLKKGATPLDQLTAWWQALAACDSPLFSYDQRLESRVISHVRMEVFQKTLLVATELMRKYEMDLKEKGWDLDTGALETTSGTRITVDE